MRLCAWPQTVARTFFDRDGDELESRHQHLRSTARGDPTGEALLPPSIYGWGILNAFAVVVDVTARIAYTYPFARLRVSFNAVGMLVVPGMAALIARILFGERLYWLQIVAGLASVGLARYGQKGS